MALWVKKGPSHGEFLKHHFHFGIKNLEPPKIWGEICPRRIWEASQAMSEKTPTRTGFYEVARSIALLALVHVPNSRKRELGLERFHPDSAFGSCQVRSRFRWPLSQHLFGTSLEDKKAKKWLYKHKSVRLLGKHPWRGQAIFNFSRLVRKQKTKNQPQKTLLLFFLFGVKETE